MSAWGRGMLMSLGNAYLEIIAPDPAQPIQGTFGERLAGLSDGGLVTWCAEGELQPTCIEINRIRGSYRRPQ